MMDFCYGFLSFSPSLTLNLPGGLSFDLMHYWDGQPMRFMCCERMKGKASDHGNGKGAINGQDGPEYEPWDKIFWCVSIEPADGSGPNQLQS
jgi:hypothetical protein